MRVTQKQKSSLASIISLIIAIVGFNLSAKAQVVTGHIYDSQTKETLVGVSIIIEGTTIGTGTDLDGKYILEGAINGNVLNIVYIGYNTQRSEQISFKSDTLHLDFFLEEDREMLNEAVLIVRKNHQTQQFLKAKRISSNIAIENIGASEMSLKGISSAAEGVSKISGVSLGKSGQVFVRGLGDRYSITTLNGLPIASPNPDNKLIPLDIFPSSTIENITVNKVYEASAFADYSGALINIGTRNNIQEEFFNVSFSTGGKIGSTFGDFYKSDSKGLLSPNQLPKGIQEMSPGDFSDYIKKEDPFGTSFSISKLHSLPDLKLSLGYGKGWEIGAQNIDFFASISAEHKMRSFLGNHVKNLTAQGTTLNEFDYDTYASTLQLTGLANLGYNINHKNKLNYTFFYARNGIDDYKRREGFDSEGINLVGSNSTTHIYSLLNNQLMGEHRLSDSWNLNWNASYGMTSSEEPDRKQVMFRKDGEDLKLFKLNRQETMRYFGDLREDEIVADLKIKYNFGEKSLVRFGGVFKNKNRDYHSTRFYYNLNNIDPEIEDIYDTDGYLNQENIASGAISILMDAQPKSNYFAGSRVGGAFAEIDYFIGGFMFNLGLRYENSYQWVKYWNDAAAEKVSKLNTNDLFPALNLKYNFSRTNIMRLSLSRTVTRPSFIEMAPFLYKESYGSAELRGNENIQNGYNYNIDLRYELFAEGSADMLSVTAYYKYLQAPIERVQETAGGSIVHSFRNASDGMTTGIELEFKKSIIRDLYFGLNGSYIYTNVVLPEGGGIYTDSKRALQGASPYLINADINYVPKIGENSSLSFSLSYNLQGPRIHAVGIYGMNNIMQKELHTLNFAFNYNINKSWNLNAKCNNMLNSDTVFTQEMTNTEKVIEVERIKKGVSMSLGFSYKF